MLRRVLLIVPVAAASVVLPASPAAADHTHFRVLGSGACVLLVPDGGEKDVQLPHAQDYAANRRHPLHVNVHRTPGPGGADLCRLRRGRGADCRGATAMWRVLHQPVAGLSSSSSEFRPGCLSFARRPAIDPVPRPNCSHTV
jgi:hypothetical protein